ncbi:MAG: aconitate hydratase AcnA [Methanosarcinales archaeon]|nr:aconitate hydratase AcnA [Methanosarcinales archaeon]
MGTDIFGARGTLETSNGPIAIYRLDKLEKLGLGNISQLPYSIKILLESLLRHADDQLVTKEDIESLARWDPKTIPKRDVPFIPSRVVLQDFTGVPAIVDLAAMRSATQRLGGDPGSINPVIPADLVIDHSVQVDYFGTSYARDCNEKREFERNRERYAVLRWARNVFDNFRVVPPGRGIVHQVNLEYLASVVHFKDGKEKIAYPDTLVGTDSHTTMINGLGVLGWGVGGIEAEAVLLGQPYYMPIPEVVGVRLLGELKPGITATDLVLAITQMLRTYGVVGKFVEFFGQGLENLDLSERATISNMAPEYGATVGFFPVDNATLSYLAQTGRKQEHIELIRSYCETQGLFYSVDVPEPIFSEVLEFDMRTVEPSLAGPKRPQDRILLGDLAESFHEILVKDKLKLNGKYPESDPEYIRWLGDGGTHAEKNTPKEHVEFEEQIPLSHGSVVIAAITSCTNTSNPFVMIGAGLLAKKAIERGLKSKSCAKTSLAPGSRVVTEYLKGSGLLMYLEALGFHLVGYGCTTCIGNSGPLPGKIGNDVLEKDLTVAAVLSGNRNFEGRINPLVKANYLASPLLVVAYAIAGTVDIDLTTEAIGYDPNGLPVYLKDIWPETEEINDIFKRTIGPELFEKQYSHVLEGTQLWEDLTVPEGEIYKWDTDSTYIREPPFFKPFPIKPIDTGDIKGARILALLGDSITTDHISPAGAIPATGPAGLYLVSLGIDQDDFNSFGSRRGNHEVMMRGTFANIRLRNKLVEKEGGWTLYLPTGEVMSIYDAAMRYIENNIPLIIIAGKEYGTGSSRDWAAKGTYLLGVKVVIVESYERIHRSNLVGMGVLPLQFKPGENPDILGLSGHEILEIKGPGNIKPGGEIAVVARSEDGKENMFNVITRLDSQLEVEFYRNGGILHKFLRDLITKNNGSLQHLSG